MKIKSTLFFSLLLSTFISLHAYGQDGLVIYGKMKVERGSLDGSIELLKNGTRDRIKAVSGSGKFQFELELNTDYVISFSQQGYVAKKLSFSTKVPADRAEEGFAAFQFQVTLFKQYEGVSFVVFNQPVGRIHYSDELADFDYDTDYTKSIQEQLAEVAEQVEEKQKEEDKIEKKKKKAPKASAPKPQIKEETTVSKAAPPTKRRRLSPPPPPPSPRRKRDPIVVLESYTVGEMGFPDLSAYGFINFGDGAGPREITKEQFDEYAKQYHDVE